MATSGSYWCFPRLGVYTAKAGGVSGARLAGEEVFTNSSLVVQNVPHIQPCGLMQGCPGRSRGAEVNTGPEILLTAKAEAQFRARESSLSCCPFQLMFIRCSLRDKKVAYERPERSRDELVLQTLGYVRSQRADCLNTVYEIRICNRDSLCCKI